ncbi:glycosyltransferase family 2 protein [Erwinia oleae]|uniref:glycosyltransferase family 2 protein n=1 Tax=Erwinia oleae TaxID=796334 RepID=UPI00068F424E|nr:glycosyltransferase family 2 protein [Erwinia oleae]
MKNSRDVLSRLIARQSCKTAAALPFVSVVTPTWERRHFLPYLLYMFQYQDYPEDRRELVILDDSEQSNADLIAMLTKYIPFPENIRYIHQTERQTIGQKRNRLNELARGEYIICMDDDDYYPADKISFTIREMRRNKAIFAGCDRIPIWYSHINRIYMTATMGANHALNGTFAYHRNFLRNHRYDDRATLAEEAHFLNNFTVPVLQLPPERSILCISHSANTFDKDFVMGSCERETRDLTHFVTDDHLLRFYQRLSRAPVKSQIRWAFFDRIVVNALSGDSAGLVNVVQSLTEQGVTAEQIEIHYPQAGAPLAHSHLSVAQRAAKEGWRNYLLLDDRARFVRQEKTVHNLNQLIDACSVLAWDVLLLGCELHYGHPLKALPAAIKATKVSRPIACAVNQPVYDDFIAMLTQTLEQHADDDMQQNSLWDDMCRQGRWFALYPSYVWRDGDEPGQPQAHHFFRKINTISAACAEETP